MRPMPTSLLLLSLCSLLFALAGCDRKPAPAIVNSELGIEAFISQHWPKVLAPQGQPPAHFSELEASLAPQSCGQCHQEQFEQWQTSLHSHTMGPGIQWQLQLMSQEQGNGCLRCHAPLAEQKALVALQQNWPNKPASQPPQWLPDDLHAQGLVCAACHVRSHQRLGPPPLSASAGSDALPHNGFTASAAFSDSRFCAACHQHHEADNPPRVNGKLQEDTWNQWAASPQGQQGIHCQSCHMPDRKHLWKGIHDPEMTRSALQVAFTLEPQDSTTATLRASLKNVGAGHHFPTYMVPKVEVLLSLQSRDGQSEKTLHRHSIGWHVNVELTAELSDTRLAAGEEWQIELPFTLPDNPQNWEAVMTLEVAPREHYERTFKNSLNYAAELRPETLALLHSAIAEAQATRYRLLQQRQPLPAASVAN